MYLSPVIKHYGSYFLENFIKLYVVQVGIGHTRYDLTMNKILDKHLFYLINTERTPEFGELLEYFRYHESYHSDYPYDNLFDGNLHMLVIKVPEKYIDAVKAFKTSKYSKMYRPEDVDKIITKTAKAFRVVTQDKKYLARFEKEINSLSKEPHPQTYIYLPDDSELDYLINLEEEYII